MLDGFAVNKRTLKKEDSPWKRFGWDNPMRPYNKGDVKTGRTSEEDDLKWLL